MPPGLTKREYFAAMAMQGLITTEDATATVKEYSKLAVNFADALIEELSK